MGFGIAYGKIRELWTAYGKIIENYGYIKLVIKRL